MLFDLPRDESPIIKVIGVGGGGSNAVTHMFKQGIVGVDFAICNTDAQAMELSPVPTKIQLGPHLTEGRGAGSKPNIGKMACEESIDDVRTYLENNCKMLFITAGMGGGTGTGAAPIIAKTAQEMDILTVAIVTLPFAFEGRRRTSQGMDGLIELKNNVDTLIIISNDKLRQIHGNLSISHAFAEADNILTTAAKGIAEIITVPGYVNVDFEDVNTVMRSSGVAIMGTAQAEGDDRAKRAVDEALHSPLLEDNDIRGAQHILLNIASGKREVTMDEIFEITEFIQQEAGFGTDLIWGNCYDETLGDKISVTVIATGFEGKQSGRHQADQTGRIVVSLDDDQPNKKGKQPFQSLFDIGFQGNEQPDSNTFEFKGVRTPAEKMPKETRSTHTEPYVREDEKERAADALRQERERERQRKEKLRANVVKLNNPQNIVELENEPAYMRRGVELEDMPDASHDQRSRWTIGDDEDTDFYSRSSFLHGNQD